MRRQGAAKQSNSGVWRRGQHRRCTGHCVGAEFPNWHHRGNLSIQRTNDESANIRHCLRPLRVPTRYVRVLMNKRRVQCQPGSPKGQRSWRKPWPEMELKCYSWLLDRLPIWQMAISTERLTECDQKLFEQDNDENITSSKTIRERGSNGFPSKPLKWPQEKVGMAFKCLLEPFGEAALH